MKQIILLSLLIMTMLGCKNNTPADCVSKADDASVVLDAIATRTSVRSYVTDRAVPDDTVTLLLKAAMDATFGFRMFRLRLKTCLSLPMPLGLEPCGLAYIPIWSVSMMSARCLACLTKLYRCVWCRWGILTEHRHPKINGTRTRSDTTSGD